MAKVVLIGAGSTYFSPSVLASMVATAELSGSTLSFVDVDADILGVLVRLAERVVAHTGADLAIEGATERRDVLPGADFVVATFAAGGTASWNLDVDIPATYGIAQPVGDSVGPGGISRALRHIPIAVGIARDMEELCPDAYLFNYTNPMTALCRAIRRESSIRSIGLCVGPELTRRTFGQFIGLPPAALQYHGGGMNHCFWLLDVRYHGHDVYEMARDLARGGQRGERAVAALAALRHMHPVAEGQEEAYVPAEQRPIRFCVELLDALGYFPGPGDRHVTEFFPEFFPAGSAADPRYGLGALPVSQIVEEKAVLRQSLEAQASGAVPLDPELLAGKVGHSEEVVEIITSIVTNGGLQLYGNIPNGGLIANLPDNAIVEVPLTFGSYGWRPYGVGNLPDSVMPYVSRHVATVELTVEAALRGDREIALQAMLADGSLHSLPQARELLDALLRAQADYLPQFARVGR